MRRVYRLLVVGFAAITLAVGGVAVSAPQEASAHNYGYWYDCYNHNTFYYQHIYVSYGWDRHEPRMRAMTYSEWVYQCGGF
jgi:hypothetical protein